MKDFKGLTFEIIDLNVNATPDVYINRTSITFSKKVLEDLNYPANVQYCVNAASKVFAVRACKSNESKSTPFAKPKSEQTQTLSTSNKNLVESIKALMLDGYDPEMRYKMTGHFDQERRTIYYDIEEAVVDLYRKSKTE